MTLTNDMYHITDIKEIGELTEDQRCEFSRITETFPFKANDYYLSLIDWDDPDDPIRRIIIPHASELDNWGKLDPSDEKAYTLIPGLEHKYSSTVLLLVSQVCGGICRYCFRKRVFLRECEEEKLDLSAALQYIKSHPEITNVLLTGGDPFMLKTSELENIIRKLREIDHVQIIRIGTRIPVFNPYLIIENRALLDMIDKYSTEDKKIYIMTHFDHPREMTDAAVKAIDLLQKANSIVTNQVPLIRGVNDDPDVLAELLAKLSFIGAIPYYIFQCRPALGNRAYTVPIEEGYEITEKAKAMVSGLAKRARFVMSHSSGKIEIVGKTDNFVYFKYLRAAEDINSGRFIVLKSNPKAYWIDDYEDNM